MRPISMLLALSLLITGCVAREEHDAQQRAIPERNAPTAANTAPVDAAAEPTTAPASSAVVPAQGPLPAPGTIGFAGFGPAKFGADQESVRMAWGKELKGAPDEAGGCYYLQPVPEAGSVYFMMEDDRLVRIDVHSPAVEAPGGGRVGMTIAEIRKRYPDLQEMPHKYDEQGKYLRVKDPRGGAGVLLFETGDGGTVTTWRIGMVPQVDYVEGCA